MSGSDDNEAEVMAFAAWQLERELGARQRVARGAGLALIELTSILEEEHAILDRSVDPLGVVLVAFAARGRRTLRAAYRLLDAGEGAEAVPLLRTISEYFIVGRWLSEDSERLPAWALADHNRRDFVLSEVMRELGNEDPDTTVALQRQRDDLGASRRRWVEERGEPTGPVPSIEQMATQLGLGFAYQLAYRTQSQSDVHATTLAADSCYVQMTDGRLRLLPAPAHALRNYDQYELGAHTLRDLLATTIAHVRSFLWSTGLEGITAALNGLRESDPRKHAGATQHIAEAAAPDPDDDHDAGDAPA